jgi:hypothetical protein
MSSLSRDNFDPTEVDDVTERRPLGFGVDALKSGQNALERDAEA